MKKVILIASAFAAVLLATLPYAYADKVQLRKFYLTKTEHTGDVALFACAQGFHMASMWEILDPSNLVYDFNLGATEDDSGQGPPGDLEGWIRTGNNASGSGSPGSANCNAWTTQFDASGTVVQLPQSSWGLGERPYSAITPWRAFTRGCQFASNVWCVEDIRLKD